MTPLSLERRPLTGARLITVTGELDASNADWFTSQIEHGVQPRVPTILDLRGLTFMDSSGLRVLLRLNAATPLHLVAVHDVPARLLQITGVWQAMTVHDQVEQAIAAAQAIDDASSAEPA
ncbi:STAS domain-containing protein [Nonomuraea zeae]|uniref:Anti-sigma factor antagonist n=2 Tax=Nonomuraea zeae TaxID=1642303 RepID=A0A5S4GLY9_9ACTN|nr:STAS domain-containing protein [Nonomuraea zeae]TMR33975.1 STAS domain-containing protein [Nonomuraea zeae]